MCWSPFIVMLWVRSPYFAAAHATAGTGHSSCSNAPMPERRPGASNEHLRGLLHSYPLPTRRAASDRRQLKGDRSPTERRSPTARLAATDCWAGYPSRLARLLSCGAPFRRLVHAAGYPSDAENSQPVGTRRQYPRGSGVDPHEVVGIERQAAAVDVDGA
jgi:hypothetical protein